MKKIISILLFLMYTMATSGAMVKMHFCGNNLESWNISLQNNLSTTDGCCEATDDDCAVNEEESNCCKDDIVALKLNDDYNSSTYKLNIPGYTAFSLPEMPYPSYSWRLYEYLNTSHTSFLPTATSIGLWQNIPLYTLFENRKVFDNSKHLI